MEDTSAKVQEGFSLSGDSKGISVQVRQSPESNVDILVEGDREFVRFRVSAGVRLVRSNEEAEGSEEGDQVCAEIDAVFVADYEAVNSLAEDGEALAVFARKNALFHVWPYWREYVHAMTYRMRLPKIVLPMFKVEPDEEAEGGDDAHRS
ncbi:hypothetical protein [Halorhodospira sp. 9622]|uniref:hypothetical protein n=1 Tax=Halorhodospira sp. 9622 TaxID=2899136 RepID=UPI001EE7D76A|nr:hypothetical protein [Halorhodospira sp. 9622]MCG5538964.1 hypothetical protein [Halorhodospira sp. 9622]